MGSSEQDEYKLKIEHLLRDSDVLDDFGNVGGKESLSLMQFFYQRDSKVDLDNLLKNGSKTTVEELRKQVNILFWHSLLWLSKGSLIIAEAQNKPGSKAQQLLMGDNISIDKWWNLLAEDRERTAILIDILVSLTSQVDYSLSDQYFIELMSVACELIVLLSKEQSRDRDGNIIFNKDITELLDEVFPHIDNREVTELENFSLYKIPESIEHDIHGGWGTNGRSLRNQLEKTKIWQDMPSFHGESPGVSPKTADAETKKSAGNHITSGCGYSTADSMPINILSESEANRLATYLKSNNRSIDEFLNNRTIRIAFYNHITEKDIDGLSACVAAGVICNTYAHYKDERKEGYLEAFLANVKAASFLNKAAKCFDEWVDTFSKSLPCCKGWNSDENWWTNKAWEIQDTVYMWDKAKKTSIPSDKWDVIKEALTELSHIAWEMGTGGDGLYDIDGEFYHENAYFEHQYVFCDGKKEQQTARDQNEDQKNRRYEKRLKRDFFPSTWEYLSDKTKNALLEAELKFDRPEDIGSNYDSIAGDYKLAFEIELQRTILIPAGDIVGDMIKKGQQKRPTIRKYSALNISLGNMISLLQVAAKDRNDSLRKRFDASGVPTWFYDEKFLDFLSRLNKKRNDYVHPDYREVDEQQVKQELDRLRRQTLGLGVYGYLPRLVEVRKSIHPPRE